MKFMYVNEAVTAVILIKAGLCSVSMAWYSGKKYPGRGSMAVSLGCMYALSDFFIGYYSNVMCLHILLNSWCIPENGEGIVWCWGTVF